MSNTSQASLSTSSNRFTPARWHFGLVIVAVLFAVWSTVFIYNTSFRAITGVRYFSLFDDAMISMRYAWNFSHGHGLVWNDGVYTEGITNMLMTLYMSVGTFLFDKRIAVLFVQVSGIAFMLIIGLLTMGIARQVFKRRGLKDDPICSILAFIAGLTYYPLAYWSLMGMETGLLTVLILAGTLRALQVELRVLVRPLLAVVLGLAFFTRPDALIPIGIILAYRWESIVGQKNWRRVVALEGVILSAFVGALTAFRYVYYGSLVPNTYILKATGMPIGISLINGVGFVMPFLKTIAIPGLLAIAFLKLRPRRHTALLMLLVAFSILYQIWVGGDPWSYWRIMSPFMPLLFVACLEALRYFVESLSTTVARILVVTGLLIVIISVNFSFRSEALFIAKPFQVTDNQGTVNTALLLQEILHPGATIAVFWAGSIPYYTGLSAIDLLGKSDRYIAQLPPDLSGAVSWSNMSSVPGHNKYDLKYSILKLQPTYTQTLAWGKEDVSGIATNYKLFIYHGYLIYLDTNSQAIDWDKLKSGLDTTTSYEDLQHGIGRTIF